MKVGFIIPDYNNERRVALLPQDIVSFPNELLVEHGFGASLEIEDKEYSKKHCVLLSREEIFMDCDTIFCLKLLQPSTYSLIRNNQMIVGWVHPTGSGRDFMKDQVCKKNLTIVDLDNINPKIYRGDQSEIIPWIPKNFIYKNSFYAGMASTMHALISYGLCPDNSMKVAVLGSGNTSQGAFQAISKFTDNVRLFYRKTIPLFYETIEEYDIIINGIEVDIPNYHIINFEQISKTKQSCLFIDAAADAGNAIEGTHYTSIDKPMYVENGRHYYEVNNSPTIYYRNTSTYLSKMFAQHIFSRDFQLFWDLAKKIIINKADNC